MTQQHLAWRVGVSQSAISRLETGTIQGMRRATLSSIVGLIRLGADYTFPDGPPPPTRRRPGQFID
jgi:transcriptional regulator with XRE-family HTH domain